MPVATAPKPARGPAENICFPCGETHGQPLPVPSIVTTHIGTCAWCKTENTTVTSATDFRLWSPPENHK